MPKRYPEEFRRKVLDLIAAGRPIAQIAADLNITQAVPCRRLGGRPRITSRRRVVAKRA